MRRPHLHRCRVLTGAKQIPRVIPSCQSAYSSSQCLEWPWRHRPQWSQCDSEGARCVHVRPRSRHQVLHLYCSCQASSAALQMSTHVLERIRCLCNCDHMFIEIAGVDDLGTVTFQRIPRDVLPVPATPYAYDAANNLMLQASTASHTHDGNALSPKPCLTSVATLCMAVSTAARTRGS